MLRRKANEKLSKADSRTVTYTFKLSLQEATALECKMREFTLGNRSLYIRAAVLNYVPKKSDFNRS